MRSSMMMLTFCVLEREYLFWGNLVQKLKIVSLFWNLVPRLNWICKFKWWCLIFLFSIEIIFFGQIGPKNLNCLFKLKSGTYNVGQNIWNKIEKSSKTGPEKKSLISTFGCFLTAIAKVKSLERRLDTRLYPHPNLRFSQVLSFKLFGNSWSNSLLY